MRKMKYSYQIFMGKSQGQKPRGRPFGRLENDVKISITDIKCDVERLD
jgi:hypothetical protein